VELNGISNPPLQSWLDEKGSNGQSSRVYCQVYASRRFQNNKATIEAMEPFVQDNLPELLRYGNVVRVSLLREQKLHLATTLVDHFAR
jgi:hypothetical protein